MNWTCKYCNKEFVFEKRHQKGAHTINCKLNPKYTDIRKNCINKLFSLERFKKIEFKQVCNTCKKEFVQKLTAHKINIKKYNKFCSKECSYNRILTIEEKEKLSNLAVLLNTEQINQKRQEQRIKFFDNKRISYQKVGRERIKNLDPLYIAGCMLYWGEGSKGINSVEFTNSDVNMLIIFKKFLFAFWDLKDEDISIYINCYTDINDIDTIESYWIKNLSLNKNNLRKSMVNNLPKSSKNKKIKKSAYGTVRLCVHKTEIIQEIFGAIQEYGSFINNEWLYRDKLEY